VPKKKATRLETSGGASKTPSGRYAVVNEFRHDSRRQDQHEESVHQARVQSPQSTPRAR